MEKTIYAEDYRALLEWLRNHRNRKGLSMRDLAKRLNVHHSWIGRVEQGERRLDIVEFARLRSDSDAQRGRLGTTARQARLCDGIGCDPHDGLKIISPDSGKLKLKKAAESRARYRIRRASPRSGS